MSKNLYFLNVALIKHLFVSLFWGEKLIPYKKYYVGTLNLLSYKKKWNGNKNQPHFKIYKINILYISYIKVCIETEFVSKIEKNNEYLIEHILKFKLYLYFFIL